MLGQEHGFVQTRQQGRPRGGSAREDARTFALHLVDQSQ